MTRSIIKVQLAAVLAALVLPFPTFAQSLNPGVHPGFTITSLRPPGFNPRVGGIDFLPNADMVLATWDGFGTATSRPGRIYILKNTWTGDSTRVTGTTTPFASNMNEPLGVKVVNGEIYVIEKDSLVQLVDANKDQVLDSKRKIASGWTRNIGDNTNKDLQFAHGLVYTPDNRFIAGLATRWNGGPTDGNTANAGDRGCIISMTLDSTNYRDVACGIRSPDGIVLGPEDGIFVTDNQGNYNPASKLVHVKQGRFFNVYHNPASPFDATPVTRPVIWMPHGNAVDKISISPTQPVYVKTGVFKGQMFTGDNNLGTLQRYFLEKVNGEYQGAVFRFSGGLQAAAHRIVTGPDGAFYVGGIGATSSEWGGWAWSGQQYGLQRMTENGNPFFDMLAVRSMGPTSFEIEFTEASNAVTAASITVQEWSLTPLQAYGTRINGDTRTLPVQTATLSGDGKKLALEIPGLKRSSNDSNFIVYIRLPASSQSTAGRTLWSSQAWYTLNSFGPGTDVVVSTRPKTSLAQAGLSIQALAGGRIVLRVKSGGAPMDVEIRDMRGSLLETLRAGASGTATSLTRFKPGIYAAVTKGPGRIIQKITVFQ